MGRDAWHIHPFHGSTGHLLSPCQKVPSSRHFKEERFMWPQRVTGFILWPASPKFETAWSAGISEESCTHCVVARNQGDTGEDRGQNATCHASLPVACAAHSDHHHLQNKDTQVTYGDLSHNNIPAVLSLIVGPQGHECLCHVPIGSFKGLNPKQKQTDKQSYIKFLYSREALMLLHTSYNTYAYQ